MSQEYTFTGPEESLGYFGYRGLSTGGMLTGSPGCTCAIAALEEGRPVPPADGRWAPASTSVTAKAKGRGDTTVLVPAAPEGGEN